MKLVHYTAVDRKIDIPSKPFEGNTPQELVDHVRRDHKFSFDVCYPLLRYKHDSTQFFLRIDGQYDEDPDWDMELFHFDLLALHTSGENKQILYQMENENWFPEDKPTATLTKLLRQKYRVEECLNLDDLIKLADGNYVHSNGFSSKEHCLNLLANIRGENSIKTYNEIESVLLPYLEY